MKKEKAPKGGKKTGVPKKQAQKRQKAGPKIFFQEVEAAPGAASSSSGSTQAQNLDVFAKATQAEKDKKKKELTRQDTDFAATQKVSANFFTTELGQISETTGAKLHDEVKEKVYDWRANSKVDADAVIQDFFNHAYYVGLRTKYYFKDLDGIGMVVQFSQPLRDAFPQIGNFTAKQLTAYLNGRNNPTCNDTKLIVV